MKKKYCIGLLAALLLMAALLWAGYQLSYRYVTDKQQTDNTDVSEIEKSVTTKGEATKKEGYYLCELHGYVVVYLSDQATIYELTEIPLEDLPQEVQEEVRTGKFIETIPELYAFLENYSS